MSFVRSTGERSLETAEYVKSVNSLLSIYNSRYHLDRTRLITGEYKGSGVMYILTPYISNLVERMNLGNITNVVSELEWFICSVHSTQTFKYEPYPLDTRIPYINDCFSNTLILELLSELLSTILKLEKEKAK